MEQHAKKKERLTIFYQRQLDKKQRLANSLREELNDAKVKLQAVEQGIKKKERNMNVVMYDMDRKQKSSVHSLEKQVGKVVPAFVDNKFWNIRYQYNDHEGFPRNSLPI